MTLNRPCSVSVGVRVAALAIVVLVGGCIGQVATQCARCIVVDAHHLTGVESHARRLFVIVPGAVGYGEEWAPAVASLRAARQPFVVFAWDGWASMARAAADLHTVLQGVLDDGAAPPELVVVGHSAGGMVAAYALRDLRVPSGRKLHVVSIGTPWGGVSVMPCTSRDDFLHAPTLLAMGSCFHHYPSLPAGVDLTEYVTSGASDPVMEPRFGRDPADPHSGPVGARRVEVDARLNHDQVVALVMAKLVSQRR